MVVVFILVPRYSLYIVFTDSFYCPYANFLTDGAQQNVVEDATSS